MAVDVDEPGRDGQTGCVDLVAVGLERADRRDAAVLDADVGDAALGTRAVEDGAAADDEVEAQMRVAFPSSITTP
jgi:hypothetical protein